MSFWLPVIAAAALGATPPWPIPIPLTIPEIRSGRHDYRPAYLTGRIEDVLDDTTDPSHVFLIVSEGANSMLVPVKNAKHRYRELRELIGAEATFTGLCDASVQTEGRRYMGRRFDVGGVERIKVLKPAKDPFLAPDILALDKASPSEIAQSPRHRMTGRVLAVWSGDKALVLTPSNRLVRIELANSSPPAYGACIEAVGFPETDLCHINLMRSDWRPAPFASSPPTQDAPQETCIRTLLERNGVAVFPLSSLGRTIRTRGTVRGLPRNGVFLLEDDACVLPVDISALAVPPDIRENGLLEVTGACIITSDNWRPNAQFPEIRGVTLVVRTPDDIRILAHPPWWTVGKLFAVVGALLAALLGILVWNRALRILAEQRGRQLYREQIQSVRAEMKFLERTNLAVELHDAISQYLTGIALELRTVDDFADGLPEHARRHLRIADNTLASCRDELRNCLWDLRHNTLDQKDLAEAVRMTVAPHIGAAQLAIRFDVPRKALSENAVHFVLQIARELATNAVRHGKATEIRIAGALDDGLLRLSVRDNGCGFDPDAAPGMEEGHFGLLGVRERIDKFEGTLEIESAPGRGTRCVATLSLTS